MLINEPRVLNFANNPLLEILASMGEGEQKHLDTGIYEVNHFGCSPFICLVNISAICILIRM